MTVSNTSDHKEKHTREKKKKRVGDFQELWDLVACNRIGCTVHSVDGFTSCKHTDQVQHDVLLALFNGRLRCVACGKRQITS